jgi:hypothetical protein
MMNLEVIQNYRDLVDSLDSSNLFRLYARKEFRSTYILGETLINVDIYVWQEKSLYTDLYIEWRMYNKDLDIDRKMTGEEAFTALPKKYRDEAVFHIDFFSIPTTNNIVNR